MNESMLKTI